jgi:hypothetical protein
MPSTIKFKTYFVSKTTSKKPHSTSSPGAIKKPSTAALARKQSSTTPARKPSSVALARNRSKAKQAAITKSKFYNIIVKGKMKNIKPY